MVQSCVEGPKAGSSASGRPRRQLGWVIPVSTWSTLYQADLHLLGFWSQKLGITAKLRDLKSQFLFSLVYGWVCLQFQLLYWCDALAQPCWRWYHVATRCFCDQSHTVVILFDIMHIPILPVFLPLFNEVRCYFIEWSYFNIIITKFFLLRRKHLPYLKFWGNLFYVIFLPENSKSWLISFSSE